VEYDHGQTFGMGNFKTIGLDRWAEHQG